MKDTSFGDRLKKLRGSLKLSQPEAAKKVGVSYASLQNHESGRLPSQNNLEKYIKFYGCDKNWLLTGIGGPDQPCTNESIAEYNPDKNNNMVEFQHYELIKNFKNKSLAKSINESLLELERLSPSAFEEIETYIKGMVRGIQLAKTEGSKRGDNYQGESRPAAMEKKTVNE